MKIEYIWIKNYKDLFKNLDINFGGEYRFCYENGSLCSIKNANYINNFFSKEYKSIINVTAIIGENGVGKTNIIRLINDILRNDGLDEQYIIIYKHHDKLYGYSTLKKSIKVGENININWIKNRSRNLILDSGHVVNLIHFSNVFDNSKILAFNSRLIDICTNKLVKDYRDRDSNVKKIEDFDLFTEFKKNEVLKKVMLFTFLNDIKENEKEEFELLVKLPKEFIIEINYVIDDYTDMINSSKNIIGLEINLLYGLVKSLDCLIDGYDYYKKNDEYDANKYEIYNKNKFFYRFLQQLLVVVIYDFEFKFERVINYELKYLINMLKDDQFDMEQHFYDVVIKFLKYILVKEDFYEVNDDDINEIEVNQEETSEEIAYFDDIEEKIDELNSLLYSGFEDNEILIRQQIDEIIKFYEEIEEILSIKVNMNESSNNIKAYSNQFRENINEYSEFISEELRNKERNIDGYKDIEFIALLREYNNLYFEDTEYLEELLNNLKDKICDLKEKYIEENFKYQDNNLLSKVDEDFSIVVIEEHNYIITYVNNLIEIIEYMNKIKESGKIIYNFNEKEDDTLRLGINCNSDLLKKFLHKYIRFNFNRDVVIFDWYDLSSGQNSYLDMISRLYMIEEDKKYDDGVEDIVLLIDEGELYLHPNIQSKFLNNLMLFIQLIMKEKKFQLILTSNSPFMISDLPQENIIYLYNKEKESKLYRSNNISKTFGANIHTLLSDNFFMQDGTIGAFARKKINKIIDILNLEEDDFIEKVSDKEIDLDEIENVILTIGEPVVRKKIMNLYYEKTKYVDKESSINIKKLVKEFIDLNKEDKNNFIEEIIKISQRGKKNDKD